MTNEEKFKGFVSPNYTQVPDELFDHLMAKLSGAELKVLLYIIRRTFGFKKESDSISLSQISQGLRTRDGQQLDQGTGLNKATVVRATRSLEERGCVLRERRQSSERGDEATTYRLNVVAVPVSQKATPPVSHRGDTPVSQKATHKKQSNKKQT